MAKKQVNVTGIKVDKIDIESSFGKYDLVPHLEELNVYENIFQPALTGHITIADSFSFPAKLPIVGEETLDIIFSLEGVEDDEATIFLPPMHVNEISSRFMSKPKSQQFSLELVSEQFMNNAHSTISKSYRGKTVEQIVQDIYSSHLDDEHKSKLRLFGKFKQRSGDTIRFGWERQTGRSLNFFRSGTINGQDLDNRGVIFFEQEFKF